MSVQLERIGSVAAFSFHGELTREYAPELEAAFEQHLRSEEGAAMAVLVLAGVGRVDSKGLEALLQISRLMRDRGLPARLFGVTESVLTVLRITRLLPSFEVHETLEEALKAARQGHPGPRDLAAAPAER